MNIEVIKAKHRNFKDLWATVRCPVCENPMFVPRPYLSDEKALVFQCPYCDKAISALIELNVVSKTNRRVYTLEELKGFALNPSTEPEELQ